MAHFVRVIASARTSVAPICPSTSATRLSVLPVSHRSSMSRTRRPWTASVPAWMAAESSGARSCSGTFFICGVAVALTAAAARDGTPRARRYSCSDQHRGLLRPVQRWRRWNDAVDDAIPPLVDEGNGGVHDVVQRSVSVLQLIHQFAQRRAGCLELHVLAEIANRTARDHVAIEDEPLDPRPVDRHRMDLHNCHSPSTGPRLSPGPPRPW